MNRDFNAHAIGSCDNIDDASAKLASLIKKNTNLAQRFVEYSGQKLCMPLKIGFNGQSATGKSTVIKKTIDEMTQGRFSFDERVRPSHDLKRDIPVWRLWMSPDKDFYYFAKDDMALCNLMHSPKFAAPEIPEIPGVVLTEHVYDTEIPHLDFLIKTRRDNDQVSRPSYDFFDFRQ